MGLYSYVVARDFGFAPNPFFGVCTLATCKPIIRRMAAVGDWVIGTGSKSKGMDGRLIFAMRIDAAMTYDEYWKNKDLKFKRPNLRGSIKQSFGDNIYHKSARTGEWIQENSHHSFTDGTPNPRNIRNDTQTDRMLLGQRFTYWGADAPRIPSRFRDFDGHDICAGRGHRSNFPPEMIEEFLNWYHSLGEEGCIGLPCEWTPRKGRR